MTTPPIPEVTTLRDKVLEAVRDANDCTWGLVSGCEECRSCDAITDAVMEAIRAPFLALAAEKDRIEEDRDYWRDEAFLWRAAIDDLRLQRS